MRAIVIGAGIGGLTAAIALRQAGHDAQVYEQAPAIGEVGAGVQIGPNASRVLARLGLGEALAAVGVRPPRSDLRRWQDGSILWTQPLADDVVERFGAPYYHVYRPDLIALLGAAVPDEVVHLGHRAVEISHGDDHIEVMFDHGGVARGDVLVGADGIHSTVRERLFGPESPRFSGSIAYRGLAASERLAGRGVPRAGSWLGPHRHFVHYTIAAGRYMNFVGVVPGGDWRVESWSAEGKVADALAEFDGWHPAVRTIIDAADRVHRWALYDREPLPRWSRGRATLLGDAAHAMLPFLAQGACSAIEDARMLARCLAAAAPSSIPVALARYEELRKPRTAAIQRGAYANATTFHLPDGDEQRERDTRYAGSMTGDPYAQRGWLYSYDVDAEPV
jgi:salicylate hydroxylase